MAKAYYLQGDGVSRYLVPTEDGFYYFDDEAELVIGRGTRVTWGPINRRAKWANPPRRAKWRRTGG